MSTKPPSGTRDFLPSDIRRRDYVIGVVRDVYERYGFEPLETPAFENIETLLGKYGEEGNRLIFKILRRGEHEKTGESDLALRYDLTVPLARVVAQYQKELPRLFRRYQIQPVWRADRPAKGRFREFFQCDIDAIGSTSPIIETEILAAINDVLTSLQFEDFVIRLNHRGVLDAMLRKWLIPAPQHETVLVALDKLDKVGKEGVLTELERRGVSEAGRTRIRNWLGAAHPDEWFEWLQQEIQTFDAEGRNAFANLKDIVDLAAGLPAGKRIRIDLTLARGLSYYTGAIIEVAVPDLGGSLGGGGRYDNLIGMFLGRDVPACGFSLGLERIIVVMSQRNMFPPDVSNGTVNVLITIWSHETRQESLALAASLRASGLRVDIYPEADKLGKQFKFASARGVPFVAILGDEERERGEVGIKDLRSGEQKSVPRTQVVDFLRGRTAAIDG